MAFSKTKELDQIIVTKNGVVQSREVSIVFEDDREIKRSYHYESYYPGQDLSVIPDGVMSICNAAWTPEVVAAYQLEAK